MAMQAGQLLIARLRRTLSEGITTIDTGLRQVNRGVSPDPPLGGSDPTADAAAVASRVQVVPQAPLEPWVTGNVYHSEPYVESTTGSVKVDFWVEAGAGEQTINVEFWDPHTEVCPVSCDPYNTFTCQEATVAQVGGSAESGLAPPITVPNPAATGQLLIIFAVVAFDAAYDASNIIVPVESGWTVLDRQSIDLGGGAGMQFAAFVRVTAAGDPVSYDFSFTDTDNQTWQAIPWVCDGVNVTAPVQDDGATTEASPATPMVLTAPSLTAVTPLPLMIAFFACDNTNGNWTEPPGMTALAVNQPSGSMTFLTCSEQLAAAGATGTRVASYDAGANGGVAFAMLIEPACGIFPDGSNP